MALPPDRGHVRTESRHPASARFDALDARAAVDLMVADHRVVATAVAGAAADLAAFIEDLAASLGRGGRLIYVGAGTSGRLGVLDAAECPPTFQSDPETVVGVIAGGDRSLRRSSEGLEDDPAGAVTALDELRVGGDDSVLGIAAGGTTPYVLGAIAEAARRGAMTGLLTCAAGTARPAACDHLIVLDTGAEVLTGSTRLKAGSATKLALNIITTVVFTRLGKVYGNLMVDLRATNDKLADRAIRIFREIFPDATRAEAAETLDNADGRLKVALAMRGLGVDAGAARESLDACGGRLDSIISP